MMSLLLLALSQAASQPEPPPAEPTIVVSGEARTDAEVREAASVFVKAVAATPGSADQFARWNQPVCPKVIGATEAQATLVMDRIRTVAAEAGIRVTKRASCAPNILVAFTDDPSAVVREVFAKRPHSGRSIPVAARADLIEGAHPIRWWYDTKVEGRYGETPMGDAPALLNSLDTGNQAGGAPGGMFAQSESQSGNVSDYNSSMIGSKSRQSIGAATIIVDVGRIKGRTADAVASYVAMVALAPLKLPPRPVPTPTITNLFRAEASLRADDLSEWDRAYITALYKTAANRASRVQSGLITASMARRMRGEN